MESDKNSKSKSPAKRRSGRPSIHTDWRTLPRGIRALANLLIRSGSDGPTRIYGLLGLASYGLPLNTFMKIAQRERRRRRLPAGGAVDIRANVIADAVAEWFSLFPRHQRREMVYRVADRCGLDRAAVDRRITGGGDVESH